jgi:hypothetical protein
VHRYLILLALTLAPTSVRGQGGGSGGDLDQAAERARRAWLRHDAVGLVANSPRLLIQLPGADPSVALGPAQAAALLADFVAPAQEVETLVQAAREVEPGRGYVELQRRFRIAGTQNVRSQSLLLGYRLESTGWSLVEFRVVSLPTQDG